MKAERTRERGDRFRPAGVVFLARYPYVTGMKVFVSSLISGMEPLRAAARTAIEMLGHQPIMAEEFGALPHSPQVACLAGIRQSAAVILILGPRYGAKQASGMSATHEEYRDARERCPILAFIQEAREVEPAQAALIGEVQGWTGGLFREGFTDAADLQVKVTRALHRFELANATAPFDGAAVLARAVASFPSDRYRSQHGRGVLSVAIAGGPDQAILRPSEIESASLAEKLEKEALYGTTRIFARGAAISTEVVDGRLVIGQSGQSRSSLTVDAQAGIVIDQPVEDADRHGLSAILVENVEERLAAALRYAAWLLDTVDPTQRLTHVVVAAKITGGFAMRTRREHEASPSSMSIAGFGQDERPPVHLSPPHMPRPALMQQADQLVVDLTTLLRRQWR